MENFPGTVIKAEDKNVKSFLDGLFAFNEINQSQLMAITGLSQSTIQNWVNRGWVSKSNGKGYQKDKVARILIINMLRNTLSLDNISALLFYINGKTDITEDDIISESDLYTILCEILFDKNFNFYDFTPLIDKNLQNRDDLLKNEDRLKTGISIIIKAFVVAEIVNDIKIDIQKIY